MSKHLTDMCFKMGASRTFQQIMSFGLDGAAADSGVLVSSGRARASVEFADLPSTVLKQ